MAVPRRRVIVEEPRSKFALYLLLVILMVVVGLLIWSCRPMNGSKQLILPRKIAHCG